MERMATQGKVRAWQVSFAKNAGDDVDAYERAVGFAISTMMSNKHERWACSTAEIARRAGVYDDTASTCIHSLKRRGWIGQQRRKQTPPRRRPGVVVDPGWRVRARTRSGPAGATSPRGGQCSGQLGQSVLAEQARTAFWRASA